MLNSVSFFLILSLAAVLAEFPDNVKKCHKGDNVCFSESVRDILQNFPNGLRSLNLINFDPLHVNSMEMKQNPNSAVNIDLKFKNIDVIGLKTAKVKQIKGLNLNERSLFEAIVPEIHFKGDYSSQGRVLLLPINGNGKCVITCKNIHFKYTFDLKPVEKNGEIYALLDNEKLEFKPELVYYHFGGLFNGNQVLDDNMNKFLNDNWREIYNEMESGYSTALGLIVKQLINNVLSKFPHDSLFLKNE